MKTLNRQTIVKLFKEPSVWLLLLNLRVFGWFQQGYIIVSGDFRPPINPYAFLSHAFSAQNNIDFGTGSVYTLRLLNPYFFLTTLLQIVGLDLYVAQIAATYIVYAATALIVYAYFKQLIGCKVTAFFAAFFFVTNAYLVVDRDLTAISYVSSTLTVLPSLLAFTKLLQKPTYKYAAATGTLAALTYAGFPNYRTTVLLAAAMTATATYMFTAKRVSFKPVGGIANLQVNCRGLKKYVKPSILMAATLLVASTGPLLLVACNFEAYTQSYRASGELGDFMNNVEAADTLRLVGKWSFYAQENGVPYVPYAVNYRQNQALVTATMLVPLFAFSAPLIAKTHRKAAVYFAFTAAATLLMITCLGGYIAHLPLMNVFREHSNWILLLTISYASLIGLAAKATLDRAGKTHAKTVATATILLTLLSFAAYPLFTGDVTRNWITPEHKGSPIPSYFALTEKHAADGYILLLPERQTYVTYNFTGGVLACGNPYPYIFSRPYISGLGTEYLQTQHKQKVSEAYNAAQINTKQSIDTLQRLGVKYLLAEKCLIAGNTRTLQEYKLLNNPNIKVVFDLEEATLYTLP